MKNVFVIIATILLHNSITLVSSQVIIANNTRVTPRCGSQLISIEVNFDASYLPNGKFTDWIVVGVSGRPECRLRGNGETKYIIEIAVFNDPCLTQIPARNVFQNRIRIGKNPVVILQEDQSVTVKCVYGLPTVETMALPVINSNFNIDNSDNKQTPTKEENITFANSNDVNTFNREEDNSKMVQNIVTEQETPTKPPDFQLPPSFINQNLETNTVSSFNEISAQTPQTDTFPFNNQRAELGDTSSMSKRFSFSFVFLAVLFSIILLLCILFGWFILLLRKKFALRNRRLLAERVSDLNSRSTPSENTWTPNLLKSENSILQKPQKTSTHQVPPNSLSSFNSHYDQLSNNSKRTKNPTPTTNLPLKSNLNEFVSKTYALGEYNNLASPAYAYTSDLWEEREVDVSEPIPKKNQRTNRNSHHPNVEDGAVSSFCSITEIVHAAETADTSADPNVMVDSDMMQKTLANCVNSIRGFGYRKLTEQEIIRWKNLIQQDASIRNLILLSKSPIEIEDVFKKDEYKHLFTTSKWHEIALCVHRALTTLLDRSNSRSELQLFVGNVHSDW